ncbi:MAG: DUF4446 family protein [Epulopiscium sp.]|jgi:hypothetical protein|nr:DUF4446 family protein [Candidatus Epulonipiscium sp.]
MDIIKLIIDNQIWILISTSIISLILLIISIALLIKLNKLKNKYDYFMGGKKDKPIEDLLVTCIDKVNEVEKDYKNINKEIRSIRKDLSKCIKKVGIVRYNAFGDMGGDLCFAVALLDENDDGVVINGIYSREGSNTYAKPVEKGASSYNLSNEEIKAIKIAQSNIS